MHFAPCIRTSTSYEACTVAVDISQHAVHFVSKQTERLTGALLLEVGSEPAVKGLDLPDEFGEPNALGLSWPP